MSKHTVDEQFYRKALYALKLIVLGMTLNMFTAENIAFDRIKPLDKVPFDEYLKELGVDRSQCEFDTREFDGHIISDGIVMPVDYDELYFEIYRSKVDHIFKDASKYRQTDYVGDEVFDICPYKNGLYEYLKDIYKIFRDIMTTEDTYVRCENATAVRKRTRPTVELIAAIKTNNLKQGCCVDRYINRLSLVSPFVMRLLDYRNGHFYLENSDTRSTDYILALFSCFGFYSEYNTEIFEQKLNIWNSMNA